MAETGAGRNRTVRPLLAAGGVAVVTAVSIAGGIVWGANGPAAEAAPADAFAAAPGCDAVGSGAVESVAPSAVLVSAERGPLVNADAGGCAWSSVDVEDAAPRTLQVDFTAHFTDKAGETSGEQAAAEEMRRLAPVGELDGAAPVAALGEDALMWPSTAVRGAAEVAFRRDNLVVRIWYGGDEDADGAALDYEDARDRAVAVAEELAAAL
ncbi:hypothetical protein HDA32_001529 [Spinactinospora alkalitolerans]|uniref:DUF3558 domain-containing protein n=1 Tax=Spinactinospora alkalitolerans TaxID=687207 RepID=A0A852TQZ5_9ACTN|nr:hypothetical protein [Spinactinospora alkalitolerans]NYE46409.1 hypothetical protein [Spinactinospora alkalitolerans]